MASERFPRALSIKDLLLSPEDAGKQQTTAVPPGTTEVAIVSRSVDLEEEKPATSANVKRIPFKWENSGSRAAANKRKHQAVASQRRRNRAKENLNLMADVDAYSREAGKLSYLVMQKRAQLLVLNGFKELVLAKQTDRPMQVLGRHPQPPMLASNTYGFIAQFVRYCGSLASITWSDPCMDFEVQYTDGTAGQVRWPITTPLKLQVTRDLDVQEQMQKTNLAKSLLPTAEWTFFESLNITKTNSMLLVFE
ncbi:unnamed protein product [Penicillium salamii]|uniref:Uncharacterized protein n=1 Tax=Penicillium salamii TaxID=1612424 RepID=A0A9W4IEE3_9EURO|nr:unnamed protein product [Penicillium salamii]CAG7935959.1 unnamed protein product [Penicillium salamii]CAG8284250.1 unnamed protein product [Penicillium salamii]CAG8367639.1 unnamed protein product [Penicillium salamii]CAG8876452.1 unnamed protein product [Penicillium salamii]